jgi:transcriptional regulator
MYNLPHHYDNNNERVMQFIKDHPFAFICGCDADNKPVATQIPCFIEERDGKLYLSGHIMRNTDHHKAFMHNENVLAVFTGAHTYVSARWYSKPQTASTWNYMSVHTKGKMKFLEEDALLRILKFTTNHFENDPNSPANFEQLSEEYVQRLIKAIVVFEVEVESLNNVFKLSQDRDKESYENIIEKLQQQDHDGKLIAEEMKLRKDELFK